MTWRKIWRILFGIAAGFLTFLVAATTLWFTDLGTPSSPYDYHSLPDPCDIIHEPTFAKISGKNEHHLTPSTEDDRLSGWVGFHRPARMTSCTKSSEILAREDASVIRVHSTPQLHMGRSGTRRAHEFFVDYQSALQRMLYPEGCAYELREDDRNACGMMTDDHSLVIMQKDNVFMEIDPPRFGAEFAAAHEDPEAAMVELMETLAEYAFAQLTG